jgi:hypothetical protein
MANNFYGEFAVLSVGHFFVWLNNINKSVYIISIIWANELYLLSTASRLFATP